MYRDDYDVWFCDRCLWTWVVPSVPHQPECPQCGQGGWWKAFYKGVVYEVRQVDLLDPDEKLANTVRKALLCLDGWAGRSEQEVLVVGETPKRYRIRALVDGTRMQGNWRSLKAGQEALVPKYAVRLDEKG